MFRFISAFMTLLILVLEIFDIINRYSHYNNILEKKVSFSAKQKFKAARNSWWHKETERAEIDFDSEFTLDFSHLGTEQPDPVMSTFHFQVIVNELRDRKPGESVPWSEQLSCYIADEYCQQPVLVNNHQLTHEWHNTIPPVLLSLDNFQKRLIKMARKKFKPLNQDLASSLETSSTIAIETLFKKFMKRKVYTLATLKNRKIRMNTPIKRKIKSVFNPSRICSRAKEIRTLYCLL